VARYGQAYKDRIVARLLPPESSSVEQVSRAVAISVATLERWRAAALANGSGAGSPHWTTAARLQAVIVTAAMDEGKRCSATIQEAIVTQGGWGGAQNHGINSSMRFCGQPFTRRVRRWVKYACGLT
jgi:transposase-like protein